MGKGSNKILGLRVASGLFFNFFFFFFFWWGGYVAQGNSYSILLYQLLYFFVCWGGFLLSCLFGVNLGWSNISDIYISDVLVLAVAAVLVVVTLWNDVAELPASASAAVALASLASVAVAACFAVEIARGSAVELVHAAE